MPIKNIKKPRRVSAPSELALRRHEAFMRMKKAKHEKRIAKLTKEVSEMSGGAQEVLQHYERKRTVRDRLKLTPEELREVSLARALGMSEHAIAEKVIRGRYPDVPAEGVNGVVTCPVCTRGKLGFSIGGDVGRIVGRCTTPDCVEFF